jgi:hypothetical protein
MPQPNSAAPLQVQKTKRIPEDTWRQSRSNTSVLWPRAGQVGRAEPLGSTPSFGLRTFGIGGPFCVFAITGASKRRYRVAVELQFVHPVGLFERRGTLALVEEHRGAEDHGMLTSTQPVPLQAMQRISP